MVLLGTGNTARAPNEIPSRTLVTNCTKLISLLPELIADNPVKDDNGAMKIPSLKGRRRWGNKEGKESSDQKK